jgi:flagellin-like protein
MISPGRKRAEEAVSPVIAIILMVAITVVLAGVLYVWVSGMADTESEEQNYVVMSPELHENNYNLTLFMRTGKEIIWRDHKFLFNGTQLNTSTESTSVGEYVYFDLSKYDDITLKVGRDYLLQLINIDKEKIMWEDYVVCKV